MTVPAPAERRRRKLTRQDREAFLEHLARGYSVRHAAQAAGRTFARYYEAKAQDEAFALAWSQAVEQGTQALEDEALRRAVDGVEEPVYQGGEMVGTVRRYSDRLLEFLLKGRRPAVYRDGVNVELTGLGGGPVQVERDAERTERLYTKLAAAGLLAAVPQIEGSEGEPS